MLPGGPSRDFRDLGLPTAWANAQEPQQIFPIPKAGYPTQVFFWLEWVL